MRVLVTPRLTIDPQASSDSSGVAEAERLHPGTTSAATIKPRAQSEGRAVNRSHGTTRGGRGALLTTEELRSFLRMGTVAIATLLLSSCSGSRRSSDEPLRFALYQWCTEQVRSAVSSEPA